MTCQGVYHWYILIRNTMDEVRKTHPGPSVFNAIFTRSLGVGLHQVAPWSHTCISQSRTPLRPVSKQLDVLDAAMRPTWRFHDFRATYPLESSQEKYLICIYTYIYIWVNYNISLTWIKAIWGWFPFLTMIPVRSQWGRYNLPSYICIYIIHPFLPAVFSLSLVFSSDSEQTLASSPSLTWPLAWRWRHPDFWIVSFLHWIPAFPMFGQIPMKKPCRFLFLLIS